MCAQTAYEAGARWVVLCDTNGGTLPHEIERIVAEVAKVVPGRNLGIHTHNDTENAVANTLAAVRAGVRQIQGTLNGLGERCGNANLTSIIPTLLLKSEFANRFEIGYHGGEAANAHACQPRARRNAEPGAQPACAVCRAKARSRPRPAFTRPRSSKNPRPTSTCARRRSATSGGCSSPIRPGARTFWPRSSGSDLSLIAMMTAITRLLDEVKAREACGYAYEAAEASFELLARRMLANVPQYFSVDSFRVMVERRHNALGNLVTVSEAIVKVHVNGAAEPLWSVGEGNGPVNALDQALRKDLGSYQKHINEIELVDYKVRILTGGTEAVTRVLVETLDNVTGERWITVGVSPNIIDASFEALLDSINYKLFRDGAEAA